MQGQVTRSGQVTQLLTFQLRHSYNVLAKVMKLSEYDHQCLQPPYLGFFISVTSGQVFFATSSWSQWAKNQLLYLLWHKLILLESYRIRQLLTIQVKICIAYPSNGRLRSPDVTNCHLPIPFDPKELETWDWCQYIRLGQANQLICNMTHFGHHGTLTFLGLRSNFELDL